MRRVKVLEQLEFRRLTKSRLIEIERKLKRSDSKDFEGRISEIEEGKQCRQFNIFRTLSC